MVSRRQSSSVVRGSMRSRCSFPLTRNVTGSVPTRSSTGGGSADGLCAMRSRPSRAAITPAVPAVVRKDRRLSPRTSARCFRGFSGFCSDTVTSSLVDWLPRQGQRHVSRVGLTIAISKVATDLSPRRRPSPRSRSVVCVGVSGQCVCFERTSYKASTNAKSRVPGHSIEPGSKTWSVATCCWRRKASSTWRSERRCPGARNVECLAVREICSIVHVVARVRRPGFSPD